jgi:hypothetical protein
MDTPTLLLNAPLEGQRYSFRNRSTGSRCSQAPNTAATIPMIALFCLCTSSLCAAMARVEGQQWSALIAQCRLIWLSGNVCLVLSFLSLPPIFVVSRTTLVKRVLQIPQRGEEHVFGRKTANNFLSCNDHINCTAGLEHMTT